MNSYGKVLNTKVVRIIETYNFSFDSSGSDLRCDPQVLGDPDGTLLPDGSDLMLKMEPEMHRGVFGWKSGQRRSCSLLQLVQTFPFGASSSESQCDFWS